MSRYFLKLPVFGAVLFVPCCFPLLIYNQITLIIGEGCERRYLLFASSVQKKPLAWLLDLRRKVSPLCSLRAPCQGTMLHSVSNLIAFAYFPHKALDIRAKLLSTPYHHHYGDGAG